MINENDLIAEDDDNDDVDELPKALKNNTHKPLRTVMGKRFSEKFDLRIDFEKVVNDNADKSTPLVNNF